VSFRAFLYEDFDRVAPASMPDAVSGPAAAAPEREDRRFREIDIVRREGFEVGRAQGLAEGRRAALAEAEVRLAQDLPHLIASLGGAAAEITRVKLACERDAALLAATALRQMLPIVAERGLGQEAAALVAEVLANAPAPAIEVRAPARMHETIERRCAPLPPGVTLVVDADMPDGGVRCAWANGRARFDGAAVTKAILAILDRCLEGGDPPHAASAAPEHNAP
jgi:flagellar biosynthesis/type III secretory pathway protein FliH